MSPAHVYTESPLFSRPFNLLHGFSTSILIPLSPMSLFWVFSTRLAALFPHSVKTYSNDPLGLMIFIFFFFLWVFLVPVTALGYKHHSKSPWATVHFFFNFFFFLSPFFYFLFLDNIFFLVFLYQWSVFFYFYIP